jgi:hypothetical protein
MAMDNLLPFTKVRDICAKASVVPGKAGFSRHAFPQPPVVGSPAILFATRGRIVRAVFFAAVAGLLFVAPTAQAAEWGIAQLMQSLAQRGAERASFVERKFIAILDKPLESSGELRYIPPDRLEKRTLKPKPELLVLDRDRFSVERGNQTHSLRLSDYPEIAAFVESLRGTLAGDRKALERFYRLELYGNQERWTLVMFPSDTKLAALVLRIDVTGTRERVRSIEILQTDGDRSLMTVERIAGTASAAKAAPQ